MTKKEERNQNRNEIDVNQGGGVKNAKTIKNTVLARLQEDLGKLEAGTNDGPWTRQWQMAIEMPSQSSTGKTLNHCRQP